MFHSGAPRITVRTRKKWKCIDVKIEIRRQNCPESNDEIVKMYITVMTIYILICTNAGTTHTNVCNRIKILYLSNIKLEDPDGRFQKYLDED